MAAFFLAASFLLTGCSERDTPEAREKADISRIKSSLKRGETVSEVPYRIFLLREAYENAAQLKSKWPDSEKVPAFLEKYADPLDRVPDKVYALSRQARDYDSFIWAINHSAKVDTQHAELLAFWKMGVVVPKITFRSPKAANFLAPISPYFVRYFPILQLS